MKWLLIICLLFSSGCSLRIFKDKVPEPIRKTEPHLERERGAAYWLAGNIERPQEARAVASALSTSMGFPEKVENNGTDIKNYLVSHIVDYQQKQYAQQDKLEAFQGKKIEGTGINILPSISVFGLILLIILCVCFPAILTVVGFLYRRASGALKAIVKTIDEHEFEEPVATGRLKASLSANMDKAHKQLIDGLKR